MTNVDPKQGYNYAFFLRSCFIGGQEKANVEGFFHMGQDINYFP